VLAAHTEFQRMLRLAPQPPAHPQQLADPGRIERLERGAVENPEIDVAT
jgi:hypothetical protein